MNPSGTILFVSHKQKDNPQEFALLQEHLRSHYSADEIYIDLDSNQPGKPWLSVQEEALQACACLIEVVGEGWEARRWIIHELATAFEREIPVIPVFLGTDPKIPDKEKLRSQAKAAFTELEKESCFHQTESLEKIAGVFDLQAVVIQNGRDTSQLQELDRLIWSQTLMPPCKGKLPTSYHLPFARNQVFTGRKQDLLKLAGLVFGRHNTTLVTQLVEGMGGVGKTQLAVEFCYRYGRFFKGVHWLTLQNPAEFEEQVALLGGKMGLDFETDELQVRVNLTLAEWQKEGPRLLVFDNLEDQTAYAELVKRLENCDVRILLTARRADWEPGLIPNQNRLSLGCFSRPESLEFLHKLLEDKYTEEELNTLAERLGHLPLALQLAGVYLKNRRLSTMDDYFSRLDEESLLHRSLDMLGKQTGYTGHDLNLTRTFLLSYEGLPDEESQYLFRLLAFTAPNQPFPLGILAELFGNKEKLEDALQCVEGASLLECVGENTLIHPLMAEFGRALLEAEDALEKMADVLARESYKVNMAGLPGAVEPLFPHLTAAAALAEEAKLEDAGSLWGNAGYYLRMIADYGRAKNLYERALAIDEAVYGPEHPNVAIRVNNLGSVLQDLGDYAGAKANYERALAIVKKELGENHPYVASTLNNLGGVLEDLGDYAGAKANYERALVIVKKELGENHPYVASTLNNLGLVLKVLGDYAGAKAHYERALAIDEAVYGPQHPNVATDVNNLGGVLRALGDYAGAKANYEQALAIDKAVYGPEHPKVAIRLNNLGSLLYTMGKYEEALVYLRRALEIREKFLPEGHPYTEGTREWIRLVEEKLK